MTMQANAFQANVKPTHSLLHKPDNGCWSVWRVIIIETNVSAGEKVTVNWHLPETDPLR